MFPLHTGKALLNAPGILKEAKVADKMQVADFGCGTLGHFTFAAAYLVGQEGLVFAVDILPAALGAVESRSELEGVENIKTVWGDIEKLNGTKIAQESIDLVILCNVAATYKEGDGVAQEVRRILKPEGRLLIVDWESEVSGLAKVQLSAEEAKQNFTKFGFTVIKEFKAGSNHWGLVMKKL